MPQYLAEIKNDRFTLPADEARHIKVARLRAGGEIKIFDGLGNKFLGRLDGDSGGVILQKIPAPAPGRKIHLFFSAIARPAAEDLLDKCTQAGVFAFHPLISERSERDLLKKWESKKERWQSILLAACKQCEQPLLPQIFDPVDFKAALAAAAAMPALACYEGERQENILDALAKLPGGELAIFIGPEGGYSAQEAQTFASAKIPTVSLGANILRAQTAATVAVWAAVGAGAAMQ